MKRFCAICDEPLLEDEEGPACDECAEREGAERECAEREGAWCSDCDGTGIGKGDPDTSHCARCHGNGVTRAKEENEPEYDDRPQYSRGDWGQPGDGNHLR